MKYKFNKKVFYSIWYDNGESYEDQYDEDLNLLFENKEDAVNYLYNVLYNEQCKELSELKLDKEKSLWFCSNSSWEKKRIEKYGEETDSIVFMYDKNKDSYTTHYFIQKGEYSFFEKLDENN